MKTISRIKVQRAASWSEATFKDLYSRYIEPLRAYVLKRVRNHHDAEDLTSQVFAQAFSHLDPKEPSSPEVAAWLYTSARNAAANLSRTKRFIATVSIEEIPEESLATSGSFGDPVARIDRGEDLKAVLAALERLTPDQRQAVILRFVDELPTTDVAKAMGRTEGSARVLLHRAITDIRRRVS